MTMPSIAALPDVSSETIRRILHESQGRDVVFWSLPGHEVDLHPGACERLRAVLESWGAGLVYSDAAGVPRIDYQAGSVRDDFDFGALLAISVPRALAAIDRAESAPPLEFGGLYDLRLRLAETSPVVRVPEPLYAQSAPSEDSTEKAHFAYVDPSARDYQIEMESVITGHLGRIGAYLPPRERRAGDRARTRAFPVMASVIIPVKNRERTVGDAVGSALAQKAPFDFNVIVVDNLSEDRTPEVLAGFDASRLVVKRPVRTDLEIGGCWNLAIGSPECGRYALQLDSDDLFAGEDVLARVVGAMQLEGFAMLVGSYTTVDFALNVVSPGLVDHREWSDENGHNNLLRVNGLGAPRGYDLSVVGAIGFPNVSYGEDYTVGLRVSRDFAIGRIYESLYWCRRWEGNTDSSPTVDQRNRFNAYKDWVRTTEIRARTMMNR